MHRWLSLLLAMVFFSSTAHADKDKARQHYKSGMASYTLEHYDQAIKEFEAGFTAEPDPVFLYNIGQAYRMGNHPRDAISFYRKYLKLSPAAPNRVEVEGHILALEQSMGSPTEAIGPGERRPAETVKPAQTTQPLGPRSPTVPAPSEGTSETTTPPKEVPPEAMPPVDSDNSPAKKPLYRRWPLWVGIAAGVVGVGAGVVAVALLVNRSPSEPVLMPEVVK